MKEENENREKNYKACEKKAKREASMEGGEEKGFYEGVITSHCKSPFHLAFTFAVRLIEVFLIKGRGGGRSRYSPHSCLPSGKSFHNVFLFSLFFIM